MKTEELNKAHEAIEMLKALNLPVSEAQLEGIARLEKEYLQENIIPEVTREMTPFISQLRHRFKLKVSYRPEMGVSIDFVENRAEAPYNVSPGRRTRYSIDGGEFMNKRRFVFTVVKQYIADHPGITFYDLENRFPSSLSHSPLNGVVRKYDSVMARLADQPDLRNRFFLEDDEVLTLSDGIKVVVYNQWGENFDKFLAVARELHTVDCF